MRKPIAADVLLHGAALAAALATRNHRLVGRYGINRKNDYDHRGYVEGRGCDPLFTHVFVVLAC